MTDEQMNADIKQLRRQVKADVEIWSEWKGFGCRRCNGTGRVFNRTSLLLTVGLPIAWLFNADILWTDCPECSSEVGA